MKNLRVMLVVLLFTILISFSGAKVLKNSNNNNQIHVIITIDAENSHSKKFKSFSSESNSDLQNIKTKNLQIKNEVKQYLGNSKDLNIINGLSGDLSQSDYEALLASSLPIKIHIDRKFEPVHLKNSVRPNLQNSTAVIGANYSWNILNITGRNIKVAVVDTGIDYTHPDLGGCSISEVIDSGNNLSYSLESNQSSDHNYTNDYDNTWTITNENFSRIAVHFSNITLVPYDGFSDIDSGDRIIIYDSNYKQIAVYGGNNYSFSNLWTPYSDGNTIHVRLISDSQDTAYGFVIDTIRNGTTSSTYNWSNCNKVIGGWDFVNNDGDPMDDDGHGTHVAGIVAANGTVRGVAPDAQLYALKVCGDIACMESDIIRSIDWAINNSANIIQMSLGATPSVFSEGNSGKDPLSLACDNAVDQGLTVVISAGNNWNQPAISIIAEPSASEKSITVGMINDMDTVDRSGDVVDNSSARGPSLFGRIDPDIVAPGIGIVSTYPGGLYESSDGTSMAAPHVSGAIALLLQANPNLTPLQLRAKLMQTAYPIHDGLEYMYYPNQGFWAEGSGGLDVKKALITNSYATISGRNTYQDTVQTDRWEFVAGTNADSPNFETANITIYNSNNFEVNYTASPNYLFGFEAMNPIYPDVFSIQNFTVPANDNLTIQINFTDNNFENISTYGGNIYLNGIGFNGTDILNQSIKIQVAVTIPAINYLSNANPHTVNFGGNGTDPIFDPSGDVYFYAYYNNRSTSQNIQINWGNDTDDYQLWVYNESGDLDFDPNNFTQIANLGSGFSTEYFESNATTNLKWMRIHASTLNNIPSTFYLYISDNNNTAPQIDNITNANNNTNFTFQLGNNITIKIFYSDFENDSVTSYINDSNFSLVENTSTYFVYSKYANSSTVGAYNITVSLIDNYGGASTDQNVEIIVQSTLNITAYSPINLTQARSNNTFINFSITANDSANRNISYLTYLNDVLNSTNYYLEINTSQLTSGTYNITIVAYNDFISSNITWNLTVDANAPTITILTPQAGIYNQSNMTIRYSVSDFSTIQRCNITLINSTTTNTFNTTNCSNMSLWLHNANYTIDISAIDAYNHTSTSTVNIKINDTTAPSLSGLLPSGNIGVADNVTLIVTTNENATCKYDTTDSSYTLMGSTFVDSNTAHSANETLLYSGDYVVYVRCKDINNNSNSISEEIAFTTDPESNDTTAPEMSNPLPTGSQGVKSQVTLRITTDEDATCKYDTSNVSYALMDSSFSGSTTSHSALEDTITAGQYVFYVRCRDAFSNTNTISKIITFTTTAPTISAGSGGTGSSPVATNAQNLTKDFSVTIQSINDSTVIKILNLEIINIELKVKEKQTNTSFKIQEYISKNPIVMNEFPVGSRAYKVISIDTGISKDAVSESKINFRILKSWMTQNSIAEENIKLYRYDNGWKMYPAELTGNDGTYYYFSAVTPGFSYFAIGGNINAQADNIANASNVSRTESPKRIFNLTSGELNDEPQTSNAFVWMWMGVVIAVMFGGVLVFVFKDRIIGNAVIKNSVLANRILSALDKDKKNAANNSNNQITKTSPAKNLVNNAKLAQTIIVPQPKQPKTMVDEVKQELRVRTYIEKCTEMGYTTESIRKALILQGISPSIVERGIRDLSFSKPENAAVTPQTNQTQATHNVSKTAASSSLPSEEQKPPIINRKIIEKQKPQSTFDKLKKL